MNNRIKKIAVICGFAFCLMGCTPKDSGLYQINSLETQESEAEMTPEGEAESGNGMDSQTEDDESQDMSDGTGIPEVQDYPIYVHICGAVNNPGVYEFRIGDRVFNAIEAAGGFTEDASEDYVNQAMELTDAMKIVIPTVDEVTKMEEAPQGNAGKLEASGGKTTYGIVTEPAENKGISSTNEDSSSKADDGCVNINTADAATLMTISGIGETRAAAIIAYRDVHGEFEETSDITKVSGIGDSTFEKIKDKITTGR